VATQVEAGIDMVSDGQTRTDMIKLFASKIRGIRLKGKPVIIGELGFDSPITLDDQKIVRSLLDADTSTKDRKIKGIITGPFTMAMSCVNEHYKDTKEAGFAFAKIINQEAKALEGTVDMIQFDEPFYSVEYPEYAKELITVIRDGLQVPVALHACGDVKDIFADLIEFPVDVLDHEFKGNPHLVDVVGEYSFSQGIGLGSVRSDSEVVETVQEISDFIGNAVSKFGVEKLMIDPDCGLKHVPLDSAKAKLQNLVEARDQVRKTLD